MFFFSAKRKKRFVPERVPFRNALRNGNAFSKTVPERKAKRERILKNRSETKMETGTLFRNHRGTKSETGTLKSVSFLTLDI